MSAAARDLLDVGLITRAHGLKGQVLVSLSTDRNERLDIGTQLFTDRGVLTVTESAAHQDRFIVRFAEIADRNSAELWRGVVLRATRLEDQDVIWIADLFGATVQTVDGTVRGTVTSVENNPASDLLVLDTGELVPLTFLVSHVPNQLVIVDVPEGLFE